MGEPEHQRCTRRLLNQPASHRSYLLHILRIAPQNSPQCNRRGNRAISRHCSHHPAHHRFRLANHYASRPATLVHNPLGIQLTNQWLHHRGSHLVNHLINPLRILQSYLRSNHRANRRCVLRQSHR